jgi:hypothetical protein
MNHERVFHDALFILIGLTWIVYSLRRERWSADPTTMTRVPEARPRRTARLFGVVLGFLNVFVALMDILHTPGH